MLVYAPAERITAKSAMSHIYFSDADEYLPSLETYIRWRTLITTRFLDIHHVYLEDLSLQNL